MAGDFFFICYDFVDPYPPRGKGSRPHFFTVDQYERVRPMGMPDRVHVYEVTTSGGVGCQTSAPKEVPSEEFVRVALLKEKIEERDRMLAERSKRASATNSLAILNVSDGERTGLHFVLALLTTDNAEEKK